MDNYHVYRFLLLFYKKEKEKERVSVSLLWKMASLCCSEKLQVTKASEICCKKQLSYSYRVILEAAQPSGKLRCNSAEEVLSLLLG